MKALLIPLILLSHPLFGQNKAVIKTYPDGSPSIEVFYSGSGEKIKEISYHENGQKDYEGGFRNGVENGTWTYWHENGQVMYKEFYKNGLEEGNQYEYDRDGQLIRTEVYKQGKLIKTIEEE